MVSLFFCIFINQICGRNLCLECFRGQRIKSYLCLVKSDQLLRAILPDVLIGNFDVVGYQMKSPSAV